MKRLYSRIGICSRWCSSMDYNMVKTSQGDLAYVDTGGPGPVLIFIHGNSNSSELFYKQIANFRKSHRVISIDLLGHGRSSLPIKPDLAYTISGYAKVLYEVVKGLGVKRYFLIGFSLGGNIALQWSQISLDSVEGIMMISSAPIPYSKEAYIAYKPFEGSGYGMQAEKLGEQQAKEYLEALGFQVDDPSVRFMIEDAMTADGDSRAKMVASVIAGKGIDETQIVSQLTVPLAIVVGKEDPALNLDYLVKLTYRHLWRGKVEMIEHAKHALPLHQSEQLNALIQSFVQEIEEKS